MLPEWINRNLADNDFPEQANQYLTNDDLVWWERALTVQAANPDDAHRRLETATS